MARRGRGEGSIYKRQDGRYTASITVEGHLLKDRSGASLSQKVGSQCEALMMPGGHI